MLRDWFFHDMRNRMTVARGFVTLLRQGKAKNNPELQEKYLGFVDEALEDAVRMLDAEEKPLAKED